MPVLPKEEEAGSNIHDQIAKNPSSNTETTASDHGRHTEDSTAQAHNSKGPVVPESMPDAASKEELRARKEELNK